MSEDTTVSPQQAVSVAAALIDASRNIAQVMRYNGDLRASADYLDRQDSGGQPYPVTLVLMSTHVSAFLRALAGAEEIREQNVMALERGVTSAMDQRPTYGPRRRDVE